MMVWFVKLLCRDRWRNGPSEVSLTFFSGRDGGNRMVHMSNLPQDRNRVPMIYRVGGW